jgi:hypothetical protein
MGLEVVSLTPSGARGRTPPWALGRDGALAACTCTAPNAPAPRRPRERLLAARPSPSPRAARRRARHAARVAQAVGGPRRVGARQRPRAAHLPAPAAGRRRRRQLRRRLWQHVADAAGAAGAPLPFSARRAFLGAARVARTALRGAFPACRRGREAPAAPARAGPSSVPGALRPPRASAHRPPPAPPRPQVNGAANAVAIAACRAAGVPRFALVSATIPAVPGFDYVMEGYVKGKQQAEAELFREYPQGGRGGGGGAGRRSGFWV